MSQDSVVQVHLLDGTYELFRHFFAVPSHLTETGEEVGATRAVLGSVLSMLEGGVTHLGVATDHVIESFRNDMWPGYKSSAGVPRELLSQFGLLEDALVAMGVAVWPMVEYEADDAMAAAAVLAAADKRVERVWVCTPDKDMGQCVVGNRVVQHDRRKKATLDEEGIREKFGVLPASIPDWLALVGDSADGFPGLSGWGAKSASLVLARYEHLEDIPDQVEDWDVNVRNAASLAAGLRRERELVYLFRVLATLRTEAPVGASVDEWAWSGPTEQFVEVCERIDGEGLVQRAERAAAR